MSLRSCVFFYVFLLVLDCCPLFKLFMLQFFSHTTADNWGNSIGINWYFTLAIEPFT